MATLTSNLLRAIAAAVDFYDDGQEVYVSVDLASETVTGVDPDRKKLKGEIVGPYRSSLAPKGTRGAGRSKGKDPYAFITGDVCYHMNWSEWVCTDSLDPGFLRSCKLPHPYDRKKTVQLGQDIDAIVVGKPAWRKFVLPYIASVYGFEEACKRLR